MSKTKILIIDDEEDLTTMLQKGLWSAGFEVITANEGEQGLRLASECQPDLIILDIMMPGVDGFSICQALREISDVPVLMLTARITKDDVIKGFETGADDYLGKPFVFKELLLRIKVILKRSGSQKTNQEEPHVYNDGVLKIDFSRQLIFKDGHVVHLTPTEYRLLAFLATSPGNVFSHKEILTSVWGDAYLDAFNSLSIYIRYLRQKIETDPTSPRYIRTQWGLGYWFAPQ